MFMSRKIRTALAVFSVSAVALTACTTSEEDSMMKMDTATSVAPAMTEETTAAMMEKMDDHAMHEGIMFTDAFVKAMEPEAEMTAIFGLIHNHTEEDITITGFTADVDAEKFEIHEVVDGKMKMKENGLTVPAGEHFMLEPGHEHFMLLGVKTPIQAGESVHLMVNLSDGRTLDFGDIEARTIGAGEEEYAGGHDHKH